MNHVEVIPTMADSLAGSKPKALLVVTRAQLHLMVVIFVFLLGFINRDVSLLISIPFAMYLLLRAKPDCLLPLLLLYISSIDFGDFAALVDESGAAIVAEDVQSPWDVQLAVNLLLPLRVFWEMVRRPETFRGKVKPFFVVLWLLAFIPAVLGTVQGHQAGYGMWTRGLRFLMMVSAYFYGIILSRNWRQKHWEQLVAPMTWCTLVLMPLAGAGFFSSFLVFFLTGLGMALAIYYFKRKTAGSKWVSAFLVLAVFQYALRTTFTVLLIALLALFLGILVTGKASPMRRFILRNIGVVTLVSVLLFVIVIAGFGDKLTVDTSFSSGNLSLSTKVQEKIFADRMRFWVVAFSQIASGPYLVVPCGRPLLVLGFDKEWTNGSHNTILETLRLTGLFTGSIILYMLLSIIKKNYQVVIRSRSNLLKLFAVTVLSVVIVGIPTGDFPLDYRVGFWIWVFAGLVCGFHLSEEQQRLTKDPTVRHQ